MTDLSAFIGRFHPRITLRTLSRGDGLLGMRASGGFGPRGGSVTVAMIDWVYVLENGNLHSIAAPSSILNRRPPGSQFLDDEQGRRLILRDLDGEADALDRVWEIDLRPLPAEALQWRAVEPPDLEGPLWTLMQEDHFGDFWADILPDLQADGWKVVVYPGFAHESVPVEAWHLVVNPADGELLGKQVAARMRRCAPVITALDQTTGPGSWLLSLGVEIDGHMHDLVPMLAHLLRHDSRWLDTAKLGAIEDTAMVRLRAPGGKRIDAPAAPIKAIVANMLDLLADPSQQEGPLHLSSWDALRFDMMCRSLLETQCERAGPQGRWQLQGDAGLRQLTQRLTGSGGARPALAPPGLNVTLRPYQLHGVGWLQYLREHQLGGILADDMGLGKTAQTLAHLLLEKQAGRLDVPALVVLPTSLLFNWQAEASRMAPALRVLCLQGASRADEFRKIAEHDVVLTTYPLLWRDIAALSSQQFHFLILDEAQTVKNATARSAAAVRKIQTRHRLCITGTPLENNLGELWAHFDFLMPGFLGDARSFNRLWRRPIEVGGESLRAQLLAQRVRPFILRRRKDEVASELPLRTDAISRVQLRGRQRELYESVRLACDEKIRRVLQRSGYAGAQITILDALLKLRQVCCDPYLLKGMTHGPGMERAKLELLRDMLPALVAEGRRILLFSQFAEMLRLIEPELDALQLPWLSLTGATPPASRGALVARFQERQVPILLISLKAGGVGLNLTAADTVIHIDPWWNPAVEEQAIARAHRIGQTRPVLVYRLVVQGSIEERILELQTRKAVLAEGILGSDHGQGPKFDEAELRKLLAPLS